MSNTVITKKALATSLKDLMVEESFEKITIGDICDNCGLNRKTFYYHFPNKFELMNWIFISEYTKELQKNDAEDLKSFFAVSFRYFYKNRVFYSNALRFEGQNSLLDFLSENLKPLILEYIAESFSEREHKAFLADIITDLIILSIKKWLCSDSDEEQMNAEEFIEFTSKIMDDLDLIVG